jgi:hypothetical protein
MHSIIVPADKDNDGRGGPASFKTKHNANKLDSLLHIWLVSTTDENALAEAVSSLLEATIDWIHYWKNMTCRLQLLHSPSSQLSDMERC